jgi:glycerol uptake facilitator protein
VTETPPSPSLYRKSVAEAIGTFILVLFGLGSVHAAVLTGAQQGVWQVAIVWAVGVMLATYAVGGVSGAHINPAMTLAFALWRGFSWKHVPSYLIGQFVGAFGAAAILFFLWGPFLHVKEAEKGVNRGDPGSIVTAMCYGEYFPNPAPLAAGNKSYSEGQHELHAMLVSPKTAFAAELLGTLVLGFVVFAVTDPRNPGRPMNQLAPVFIGLTVAALISIIGPLTQACFNPARDFGPRLFAYFAGWGSIAIPWLEDWNWLTVYVVAPILGACLGGALYNLIVRRAYPATEGEPA